MHGPAAKRRQVFWAGRRSRIGLVLAGLAVALAAAHATAGLVEDGPDHRAPAHSSVAP